MIEGLKNAHHDILEELFKRGVDANGRAKVQWDNSDRPTSVPYTLVVVDVAGKAHDDTEVKAHLRTLRLLLEHGADPFVALLKGEKGSGEVTTLLHTAGFFGDDELATFLLDKGLDPLAISVGYRNTPGQVASIMGHPRTAQILSSHPNSPN